MVKLEVIENRPQRRNKTISKISNLSSKNSLYMKNVDTWLIGGDQKINNPCLRRAEILTKWIYHFNLRLLSHTTWHLQLNLQLFFPWKLNNSFSMWSNFIRLVPSQDQRNERKSRLLTPYLNHGKRILIDSSISSIKKFINTYSIFKFSLNHLIRESKQLPDMIVESNEQKNNVTKFA